jgi:hypothetical protein
MMMQKIVDDREEAIDIARNFAARLVSLIQLDVSLRMGMALLLEFGIPPSLKAFQSRAVDAVLNSFRIRLMDELKGSGYFNLAVSSPNPSARMRRVLKRLNANATIYPANDSANVYTLPSATLTAHLTYTLGTPVKGVKQMDAAIRQPCPRQARRPA